MRPCRVCGEHWFNDVEDNICASCKSFLSTTCDNCLTSFYGPDYKHVCPDCGYDEDAGDNIYVCTACHVPLASGQDSLCELCQDPPDLGEVEQVMRSALSKAIVLPCERDQGPRVRIVDADSLRDWPADDVPPIVGQRIKLAVVCDPAAALAGCSWTINGEHVKNYSATEKQGKVELPTADDLANGKIEFYWIAAGQVSVSVALKADGKPCTSSVSAKVRGPTRVSMTSKTSIMHVTKIRNELGRLSPHLTFGGVRGVPGILWTCTAKVPVDGELACTQLIRIKRWTDYSDDSSVLIHSSGAWVLDEVVHYDINPDDPEDDSLKTIRVKAGAKASTEHEDSPARPLGRQDPRIVPQTDAVGYDEVFRIFFMFRPAGPDCIWVTLATMDWGCEGEAYYVDGKEPIPWALRNDANAEDPEGTASHVLPEWSKNRKDLM